MLDGVRVERAAIGGGKRGERVLSSAVATILEESLVGLQPKEGHRRGVSAI